MLFSSFASFLLAPNVTDTCTATPSGIMGHELHHHHHHHHHHHEACSHDGGSEIGQKNKNHFDDVAATIFDTPWIAKLSVQIGQELSEQIEWIGSKNLKSDGEAKLFDYACGNGVASRALAPYFSTVRGMDISENMVKQYNIEAKQAGYSDEKTHAVSGDLVNNAEAVDSELSNFDLIVMTMALHHVDDPKIMIQKLSERLAPGGVLLFVDWVAGSESGCSTIVPPKDSAVRHTVSRMGFEQKELGGWFQEVGLSEFGWKWFSERSHMPDGFGGDKQLFLAKAVRG